VTGSPEQNPDLASRRLLIVNVPSASAVLRRGPASWARRGCGFNHLAPPAPAPRHRPGQV